MVQYTKEKMKGLAIILKGLWRSTFEYFKDIFKTSWKSTEDMFREFDRSAKELNVALVVADSV
jgi:hypothetical protein